MKNLDKEEKEILNSFELDEWESIPGEVEKLRDSASETIRKKKRINIRIAEADLSQIRIRAIKEGIPYQTLISSILHKYATGQLENK